MLRTLGTILVMWICGAGLTSAQDRTAGRPRRAGPRQPPPATVKPAPASNRQESLTDAERIMRLQRTIAENQERLDELKAKLLAPEGDYAEAETEFKTLDQELDAKNKELQRLKDQGQQERQRELQAETEALKERWRLAKDRFDLAIQERKTLQEQIVTLEQRIAQDRAALERLLAPPSTAPAATPAGSPTTMPAGAAGVGLPAGESAARTATAPTVPRVTVPGAAFGEPQAGARPAETGELDSAELRAAQQEAAAREMKAQAAREAVRSVQERMTGVKEQLAHERTLRDTARQKVAIAQKAEHALSQQYRRLLSEGAPAARLRELWTEIDDARDRARRARQEENACQDRIEELESELKRLQEERIEALEKERQRQAEAKQAQKRLETLRNPFSPRNLWQWAMHHGTKIVGILAAMIVLLRLARVAEHRIVALLARRSGPGTREDRENRARTLVSVFHHAATWVVVIGGILMVLSELGLPIVPLMGGAAVLGLAVAFGAQNLVRDYFAGFMILLENQYGINDVIKVGEIGGLVERITLRVTVLRGLDGTVHFIPNGQIDKVSNMTHGWSRALFDIGVAYKEDVDRVMKLLVDLGKELRADPNFSHLILDDPEMLGVDQFGDSAVVIKFFIKTRPLQQWTVKRELLRRVKKRFDELGIEIPFPHRTIFHHYGPGEPPAAVGKRG